MGTYLYTSALRDFMRPKRIVVWLLVAVAVGYGSGLWASLVEGWTPREQYGQMMQILVLRLVALAAAFFATGVVAQEVEQKTIIYMLTRPVVRWKILLARLLAAVTAVFVIATVTAALVAFNILGAGGLTGAAFMNDLKAMAVGSLAYVSLFVLVSLFVNRSMIVTLLFAFGWETAVPNMTGNIDYLSVYSYMSAIAAHPTPTNFRNPLGLLAGQFGTNDITAGMAWQVLVVLIAATATLGCWWFTHFEYVPREDSE